MQQIEVLECNSFTNFPLSHFPDVGKRSIFKFSLSHTISFYLSLPPSLSNTRTLSYSTPSLVFPFYSIFLVFGVVLGSSREDYFLIKSCFVFLSLFHTHTLSFDQLLLTLSLFPSFSLTYVPHLTLPVSLSCRQSFLSIRHTFFFFLSPLFSGLAKTPFLKHNSQGVFI